ncbi:MAG: thiamine pyrophosphate-binding protein [Pseudomonadales bacterium]|mgnify:CR=1 FL=1|nr:thiamine pyrophosphate-binding protein [Pseudomonadales bacterium]MDP6469766.1 thiamine pyrophosphate-binding protein [Pseudomonadales bacterium]MDP6827632.1 thiamine pyrophosphate-binding protein [Pseudomonadales bacterium]MDP6972409.1 thiamine pyrophosphate-binding protein [Pseudomonadales bacterium]
MATQKLLSEEVSVTQAILRVLEEAGIDMVFGIAGGNMGQLYDALYDRQSSIRAVLVRYEQLASVRPARARVQSMTVRSSRGPPRAGLVIVADSILIHPAQVEDL